MKAGERNAIGLKDRTAPKKGTGERETYREKEREVEGTEFLFGKQSERARKKVPAPCGDCKVSRKCTLTRNFLRSSWVVAASRELHKIGEAGCRYCD